MSSRSYCPHCDDDACRIEWKMRHETEGGVPDPIGWCRQCGNIVRRRMELRFCRDDPARGIEYVPRELFGRERGVFATLYRRDKDNLAMALEDYDTRGELRSGMDRLWAPGVWLDVMVHPEKPIVAKLRKPKKGKRWWTAEKT